MLLSYLPQGPLFQVTLAVQIPHCESQGKIGKTHHVEGEMNDEM